MLGHLPSWSCSYTNIFLSKEVNIFGRTLSKLMCCQCYGKHTAGNARVFFFFSVLLSAPKSLVSSNTVSLSHFAVHFEGRSTLECLLLRGMSTYNLDVGGVPSLPPVQ